MKPPFPHELYIAFDSDDDAKAPGFLACRTQMDVIDDDGPTRVARYQYMGEETLIKKLQVVDGNAK